jgi:hypothetical protein
MTGLRRSEAGQKARRQRHEHEAELRAGAVGEDHRRFPPFPATKKGARKGARKGAKKGAKKGARKVAKIVSRKGALITWAADESSAS